MAQNYSLVWIDLEMTGLEVEHDRILEIATIITDNDCNIVATGPSLVIHQPDELLNTMNPWCIEHHGASGLTKASRESTITQKEAQEQTLAFIKEYCKPKVGILCGNSVWQDRIFLQRYMPAITDYLHYRIIDVSSLKEVVTRWCTTKSRPAGPKKEAHRALEDIKESIAELTYYKNNFFLK